MEDRFSSPKPLEESSDSKLLPALAIILFWGGAAVLAAKYYKPDLLVYIGGDRPELKSYAISALVAGFLVNLYHMATKGRLKPSMTIDSSLSIPGIEKKSWSTGRTKTGSEAAAAPTPDQEFEFLDDDDDSDNELRADDTESEDDLLDISGQWKSGKIICDRESTIKPLWAFAVFFNAFSIPSIIPVTKQIMLGQYGLIFVYIFPILGFVFLYAAFRVTAMHRKFGEQVFQITDRMGRIGESLKGTITSATRPQPTGDYSVKLACRETITTGSGKSRKTRVETHWEKKQTFSYLNYNPGSGLAIAFDIPKSLPESYDEMSRGSVRWTLSIHAPMPGVNYEADFDVPVFRRRKNAHAAAKPPS